MGRVWGFQPGVQEGGPWDPKEARPDARQGLQQLPAGAQPVWESDRSVTSKYYYFYCCYYYHHYYEY